MKRRLKEIIQHTLIAMIVIFVIESVYVGYYIFKFQKYNDWIPTGAVVMNEERIKSKKPSFRHNWEYLVGGQIYRVERTDDGVITGDGRSIVVLYDPNDPKMSMPYSLIKQPKQVILEAGFEIVLCLLLLVQFFTVRVIIAATIENISDWRSKKKLTYQITT